MLERLFKEVKRRTRVVGVFPNERSASTLATEIALRSSEEWALRRYLTMNALQGAERNQTHTFRDIDAKLVQSWETILKRMSALPSLPLKHRKSGSRSISVRRPSTAMA
jgi:Transposase, Mutator family